MERKTSIKLVRRKIWWRDNFLLVIISVMIPAYFAYDLIDKQANTAQHLEIMTRMDDYVGIYNHRFTKTDNQLYTMTIVLVNDPNTDPMLREVLIEYLKSSTRGGSKQ